jgi:hypothetical protein
MSYPLHGLAWGADPFGAVHGPTVIPLGADIGGKQERLERRLKRLSGRKRGRWREKRMAKIQAKLNAIKGQNPGMSDAQAFQLAESQVAAEDGYMIEGGSDMDFDFGLIEYAPWALGGVALLAAGAIAVKMLKKSKKRKNGKRRKSRRGRRR